MAAPDLPREKQGKADSVTRSENGLGEIVRRALRHKLQPWLRKFLVIDEVWSDVEITDPNADIVQRYQIAHPPPGSVARVFHTLVIDLTISEETLWKNLEREVRKQIRRAEREGVHVAFDMQDDRATMDAFERAYENLQVRKSIYPLNKDLLHACAKRGRLNLSIADTGDGETVSWHAYSVDNERAQELYSVTSFSQEDDPDRKAFIGRANRLHHWQDILQFRARGCKVFDQGGWYAGSTNQALLKVNRFKEGFGGSRATSYNVMTPLTLKGRMAIATWRAAMVFLDRWPERGQ